MGAAIDRVRAVVEPVVVAGGYDLEDLSVTAAGRRRQVRIAIDSDHGVDLDDAAALSGVIGSALDDSGAMGEDAYTLEVSSRGAERPLTLPRHWRRATGRRVACQLVDESEVIGRIVSSDEDGVVLQVHDDSVRISFDQIGRAVIQLEFSRSNTADEDAAGEADHWDDNGASPKEV
jgi:ribosome maturation factor RimP